MKRLLISVVALLSATGAALAADLVVEAIEQPFVAAGEDPSFWDGFYAGVVVGKGFGSVDYTDIGLIVGADPGIAGGMIGATLGYNTQFDNIVLGIEGDLSWAHLSGSLSNGAGVTFQSELEWLGTLRGRLGFDLDPVLLYATAGLAVGGLTTSLPGIPGMTPHSATHAGFTVGAGAEARVTDDVTVKAEYLYTDLGTQDIPTGALFAGSTANTAHPIIHAVRFGANVHF